MTSALSGSARGAHNASSSATALCSSQGRTPRSKVMLATARVIASDESGRSVVVRALLDQGSEITFISERLAQSLRLRRFRQPIAISAVGGVEAGTCQYAAPIRIAPLDDVNQPISVTASILKELTRYASSHMGSVASWPHVTGLNLADPTSTMADAIDVIIGADLFQDVLLDGVCRGSSGQPVAQNTIFGWILSGLVSDQITAQTIVVQHCSQLPSLEQELWRFWEIEEVPTTSALLPDDQQCEDHFLGTHHRAPNGRYVVRLPFKHGPPIQIGHSRAAAENSLRRLHRRFAANSALRSDYSTFLKDYEKLGHMRRANKVGEAH